MATDGGCEIATLEERLRPAPADVVDDAIDLVLEGHGGRLTNEAKAKAYCIALEGLPAEAIADGVKAVLQGRAPGLRPEFAPTAPQLAAICRGFRDREAAALVDARRRGQPPPDPDPEPSPVVAAGLRDLAEQMRRSSSERSLAAAAANLFRDGAVAAEARARAQRVAAGLAGRDFPAGAERGGRAMSDAFSRFVDRGGAAQAAVDDLLAAHGESRGVHIETPAAHARRALGAAFHALRSYQYGNAAPDLARDVADECEIALARWNLPGVTRPPSG